MRRPRGWDAHKKVYGRKRVALVDAEGFWLAVGCSRPMCRTGTLPALDAGTAHWPSLREAIIDRIFRPAVCQQWANFHGMRHHVVERDPAEKGFWVLPRRWVVERGFG